MNEVEKNKLDPFNIFKSDLSVDLKINYFLMVLFIPGGAGLVGLNLILY